MNFGRTIGDRGLLTVSAANVLSLCSDDGTHSVAADQRKTTVTRTAAAAVAPFPLVRTAPTYNSQCTRTPSQALLSLTVKATTSIHCNSLCIQTLSFHSLSSVNTSLHLAFILTRFSNQLSAKDKQSASTMANNKRMTRYSTNNHLRSNLRRRVEEVDYWKQRAGWFDDDVSMKEYNTGVYDTYYQEDDAYVGSGGGGSGGGGRSGGGNFFTKRRNKSLGLKIAAAVIAILIAVLVFRILSRRSSKKKSAAASSSSAAKKSSSSSRSRSRSRTSRSRSRTRRGGSSSVAGNYELMDDKSEARSKRSSRSRSRSRRRSKSSTRRSSSKSRSKSSSAVDKRLESREVLV